MIISRTPFRISFFGGGTDYPAYYLGNGGAVISTTINKYCYITCRYLPPFFKHKHNIVYSKIEKVVNNEEIQHPAFREILKFMNITKGLEIHYDADLPAWSGLGSSSAFAVGLLNSLYALRGQRVSNMQLALDAIHVERDLLGECVGSQDQVAAAFGGLNRIDLKQDGSINVAPLVIKKEVITSLENHLIFFFTGFTRYASNIAKELVKITSERKMQLSDMYAMVNEAEKLLFSNNNPVEEFGKLLHESWKIKRVLTDKISNHIIDGIYDTAMLEGAYGGKLIGAGGGGFMAFIAPPELHNRIIDKLGILHVPIKLDRSGTEIIFYTPEV